MKIILMVLLMAVYTVGYAHVPYGNVAGLDSDDQPVFGVIFTDDPWQVEAQLVDSEGNVLDYNGRWNGVDKITGETEDGEPIDLTVVP